jgi:predicted secreted protein
MNAAADRLHAENERLQAELDHWVRKCRKAYDDCSEAIVSAEQRGYKRGLKAKAMDRPTLIRSLEEFITTLKEDPE